MTVDQFSREVVPISGTGHGYVRIGSTVVDVEFGIAGDLAILQGDIILGTVAQVSGTSYDAPHEYTLEPGTHDGPNPQAELIVGAGYRWPNCTIPYMIDSSLASAQKTAVTAALSRWTSDTPVTFVVRDKEVNYVCFTASSSGCASYVGMVGGKQLVKLGSECTWGNVLHEIGHVIGLFHEQARWDRDEYVTVYLNNLTDQRLAFNFDKLALTKAKPMRAYDYDSVMHYPRDAFAIAGTSTIIPKQANVQIGQRDHLSRGDISVAKKLINSAITLTGCRQWTGIPVAFSNGDGTFKVTNTTVANFPGWASEPNAKILIGHFDRGCNDDLLLIGGATGRIRVAFSNGDGTFKVTNEAVADFPGWASEPNVKILIGDFNGNGRDDIALTGSAGWNTIPVAFSNGDGTFKVTNQAVAGFPGWAAEPSAHILVGDFDGGGRDDLLLIGSAAGRIRLAFPKNDGTFRVTDEAVAGFPGWASETNVRILVGDFNGDGRDDIALTGSAGWNTIPVAFSNGDGTFNVTNKPATDFAQWAAQPGVTVCVGDFDGDGRDDLLLIGGRAAEIRVAFSNGDGTFRVTNEARADFPGWASTPNVRILVGDFNGDGRDDIALTGSAGWNTIPVAFSNGDGTFNVTNKPATDFAKWAAEPGVTVCLGRH